MKRFLALLLLGFLGLAVYGYYHPRAIVRFQNLLKREQTIHLSQETIISLAYQLDKEQWTEFSVPYNANRIKILTNSLTAKENALAEDDLRYSMSYQLIDASSQAILKDGIYHFKSRLTLYRNDQTGEQLPSAILAETQEVPTDGRIMQLDLSGIPPQTGLRHIRFRIHDLDSRCSGLLIRVYMRQYLANQKGSNEWQRLHTTNKEKLALGNTYPQELLERSEINSLIKNQWSPAGPSGIPDRDFRVKRLYLLKEPGTVEAAQAVDFTGLQAGPDHRFTFAVGEEGSDLRLLFTPVAVYPSAQTSVTVHWFGRRIYEDKEWTLLLDHSPQSLSNYFEGGLIEVSADKQVHIQIFDNAKEDVEIAPESLYSKMYSVEKAGELVYAVQHIGSHSTPLRITLRAADLSGGTTPHSFTYRLADASDTTIATDNLPLRTTPSLYDRTIGLPVQLPVSEPVHFYFRLPPEVQTIHLQNLEGLLVSVANRPPTIAPETLVPEDYYRSSFTKDRFSNWFPLSPQLKGNQAPPFKTALVKLQQRPSERNQDLLLGKYVWQSFTPDGDWQGHYVFFPRTSTVPLRTESLSSTFHELNQNIDVPIQIQGPEGIENIKPELVYLRNVSSRSKLRLQIDGEDFYVKTISGKRGNITLPSMTTGDHVIQVGGLPNGRVFLSNLPTGNTPHTKRFAYRLSQQGMTITYTKEKVEELLGLYYYAPCGSRERVKMRILVSQQKDLQGPFEGFTQLDRIYNIRAGDEPLLPLLHSDTCTDSGQQFLFPLGPDLPAGTYTLKIKPETNAGGLILMYRVTPGDEDWKKIFREEG